MKINRFLAHTMRDALAQVREEQGPDSVILSNRRVDGGVEVIAAIDYDETFLHQAFGHTEDAAGPEPEAPSEPEVKPADSDSADPEAVFEDLVAPIAVVKETNARSTGSDPAIAALRDEIQTMRSLMQQQLSHVSPDDLQLRYPRRSAIVRRLNLIGLDPTIVDSIVRIVPPDKDHQNASRLAIWTLLNRIKTSETRADADGGTFAFVGPTGVGKTMTIAKIATRFALQHGPDSVALVTLDGRRIGAQEQLFRIAKIIGVPVVASNQRGLANTLARLERRRLVLIDTTGVSPRDPKLIDYVAALGDDSIEVRTLLTLSASTQTQGLREAVDVFGEHIPLAGTVITKLDESTSLGGVLSTLISSNLSSYYFTDGPHIPADLHDAHTFRSELIKRAVGLTKRYAVDNDPPSNNKEPKVAMSDSPAANPTAASTRARVQAHG